MFVTALYKVYVIWKFCCTGNKAFMKVYQWFYWTSNPQFWEKSQPVPGTPKQSCSTLHNFSWKPCLLVPTVFLLTPTCSFIGTNCVPLHADLFLYSYETYFIQRLLKKNEQKLIRSFHFMFRYTDDVISVIIQSLVILLIASIPLSLK